MPEALEWTEAKDAILREAREGGASWEDCGILLGCSRSACRDRAVKVGIWVKRGPAAVDAPAPVLSPREGWEVRDPLPTGHPTSWGLINEGLIILAGSAYQIPDPPRPARKRPVVELRDAA